MDRTDAIELNEATYGISLETIVFWEEDEEESIRGGYDNSTCE